MDLRETGCEDERVMELFQNCHLAGFSILAVLNFGFCYHSVSKLLFPEMGSWAMRGDG